MRMSPQRVLIVLLLAVVCLYFALGALTSPSASSASSFSRHAADLYPPRQQQQRGGGRKAGDGGKGGVVAPAEGRSVPDGYTPIALEDCDHGWQSKVVLCKIDWEAYHAAPHVMPMQKDLIHRFCSTGTITRTLKQLQEDDPFFINPAGLVFHESRVGSTLIANMLAVDNENIVHSEAPIPPTVIKMCSGADATFRSHVLRLLMRAMSNSASHRRVFFKLQSINSVSIDAYMAAFPSIPWIFVYREPVDVMISNMKHGPRAPCLRYRYTPLPIHDQLKAALHLKQYLTTEEACALHLAALSQSALNAIGSSRGSGVAVGYEGLADTLLNVVFPRHFGYHVSPALAIKIKDEAGQYSKARLDEHAFEGDSEQKRAMATQQVKDAADRIIRPIFDNLVSLSTKYLNNAHQKAQNAAPTRDPDAIPEHRRNNDDGIGSMQGHHARDSVAKIRQQQQDARAHTRLKLVKGPGGFMAKEGYANDSPYYPDEASLDGVYESYPETRPLSEILNEWPPDDPDVPDIEGIVHGSLEVLNYSDPSARKRAEWLRLNEVPFKVHSVPFIERTVERWSSDLYLSQRFGREKLGITTSETNHFMYYSPKVHPKQRDYQPPTGRKHMRFDDFMETARQAEKQPVRSPHFYLQFGTGREHNWVYDDLDEWAIQHNFWMVDPSQNRGINCRFGARGIVAENHYDGGRNFIAMLRGSKRYVIAPPDFCKNMNYYPRGHPEARHSKNDWAAMDLDEYPMYKDARAINVVVQTGEVLYLPSYWSHYIVSNGVSMQCNTRSGKALRGHATLEDCGFY